MEKRLYRDELNKKVGGVCAGLAEYLNIDVTVIRVIFLLALVLKGVGAIPYIVLWIVLPKKPYFANPDVDYTVPPQGGGAPFGSSWSQPGSNPFATSWNQQGAPFTMPAKKRSGAGLIVGIALVLMGSFFLLDQLDILPDFDFSRLWPIIFIALGVTVIFSGRKKPWDQDNWVKPEEKQEAAKPAEEKPADTTPEA